MTDPVSIDVVINPADVQRVLDMFASGSLDTRPLSELLIEDWYKRTADVFKSQGASHGPKWDFTSPYYGIRKREVVGHERLLELSGGLLASMTSASGPGSVKDVTADGFAVGTSLPYASKHQEGSEETFDIGEPFNMTVHGVPARPMVSWLAGDQDRWQKIATDWLTEWAANLK